MQHIDTPFDPFAGSAIERTIPTTAAQREIWASAQMGVDASLAYNEAIVLRVRGPLQTVALERALTALVARHESLRATFSRDGLSMIVTVPADITVRPHDWQGRTSEEHDRALAALSHEVVTTPFSLEDGPLVRFDVASLAADDHALFISAHHIACDGWSFGVLLQELGQLYEAQQQSRRTTLPPADSFSDYAQTLLTPDAAASLVADDAYWVQQYATIPDPCELPVDRPRAALRTYAADRLDLVVPADLTTAIRRLGASNGCSLFVTLLSGFSAVLSRLTQQDDLVVGVASAGQSVAGQMRLVGHCVNTLPIRLQPSSALPFVTWMERVRGSSLDAFEHQGTGLGRLLERLALRRTPDRPPLATVMFNLDRALPPSTQTFGGLQATMRAVPRRMEHFELFLNVVEDVAEADGGLMLECQYNTDLFDEATIRRWLTSYQELLRAAAAAAGTTIGALPVCTDEDRAALARCNDTARDWPADALVHDLTDAGASRGPERIAVEQGDAALPYGELTARANQLAQHLRARGIGRGAFVGIALDRTPSLLVAMLGVLKAGAAYVPLDPALPTARLTGIANDAALAAILTESSVQGELPVTAPIVVSLDGDAAEIAAASNASLPRDDRSAAPDDAAYVIFTSGSTGKPKGVVVPHRAVVNLLRSVQDTPGLSDRDVVLAITTLGFDIAVSELLLPLTVGARIVLVSREVAADGALLRETIESRGVTFIDATPASYRLLLAAGWQGHAQLRAICTGEAMPRELAQTLVRCTGELWNGYGPTETTVWSTFHRVHDPVERVLIGRPVANTVIALRDANGQPVPVGVPGELFIGGTGVATGYLHRPELTAERFTADAVVPGRRWYRTGDLVRLLPSGELECLGRADDQVKVRGYRIEPGEIAVTVARWPGVQQAVVIAREDRADDVRLVAYVVAADGVEFGAAFRAFLKETLPDYMIPSATVRLGALPLNASGKVDRRALPAPASDATETIGQAYVAPRTETEQLLAELWTKALAVARVGVHDDFFALGGHSLLASQILARLRRDHGVQLTFRRIFDAPTIEQLARIIDADRAAGVPQVASLAITPRPNATTAPLSKLQERLWLLSELDPERQRAHNNAASWRLTGPLDATALARAIDDLIAHHPMLRTGFVLDGDERQQVVHTHVPFTLAHADLQHVPAHAQEAALDAYFHAQHQLPFDVSAPPLFRASLIALAPERHVLYTLQSSMIWDGWSFDVFLRELTARYCAIVEERMLALPTLPVTYGDFAVWQRSWLESAEATEFRDWWDARLAGSREPLALPTDRARAAERTFDGAHVSIAFDRAELEALQALARRYDSTLYMVMFAAYNVLLHLVCDQQSVLVASPMRARTRPELEEIIGPFVNTVVLRTQIDAGATFADVLRQVRENTLDAHTRQELPFEQLQTALPVIRALFSLQDARERPLAMGPLLVEQRHVPTWYATNDITMWTMQYDERLLTVLNYSTALFNPESAQTLLAQYRALIGLLRDAPDRAIASLPLLPTLAPAVAAPPALPRATPALTVSAQLADAAQQHATRDALQYGTAKLSYDMLWRRSGHVASALQAQGIGAEDVVAIDLPLGADRLVATLAVHRLGAHLLATAPEDSAAYVVRLLSAATPRVRLIDRRGARSDDATSLLLGELEAAGAANASALFADEPRAGGSEVHWMPDASGGMRGAETPSWQVDAQSRAFAASLALQPSSRVLLALSPATPGWLPSVLATLSVGGTVCLVDDDIASDPADFADEVERRRCTTLVATAATWRMTLDSSGSAEPFTNGLLVGGGLDPLELRTLAGRGTRLWSAFGVAESGAIAALHHVDARTENWFAGTPIDGVALDVRTRDGQPRPPAMSGWLHVATTDDTAWRFAGLRARRLLDGRIQLLPENTPPLSLGGVVVDPAIIDAELQAALGSARGAVAEQRDGRGTARVVAYVLGGGAAPDDAALRSQLRARMPLAWAPARTVVLDELPRRPDGTVDRAALPSPFAGGRNAGAEPSTEDERLVAELWTDVLSVASVGTQDNFFQLGGTSLLCFRVVEMIRRRTEIRISPRTLLLGTLGDAAAELSAQRVAAVR